MLGDKRNIVVIRSLFFFFALMNDSESGALTNGVGQRSRGWDGLDGDVVRGLACKEDQAVGASGTSV